MSHYHHFTGKQIDQRELTTLPQIHKVITGQSHDFCSVSLIPEPEFLTLYCIPQLKNSNIQKNIYFYRGLICFFAYSTFICQSCLFRIVPLSSSFQPLSFWEKISLVLSFLLQVKETQCSNSFSCNRISRPLTNLAIILYYGHILV